MRVKWVYSGKYYIIRDIITIRKHRNYRTFQREKKRRGRVLLNCWKMMETYVAAIESKAGKRGRENEWKLHALEQWLLFHNLFISDEEKLGRKGNLAKVACKTFSKEKLFRRWENEIFIKFFSPCRIRHNLMKESYDQIRRFTNNNLHEPWFFVFCGCQPRSIKVSFELSHMWWNEMRQRTCNFHHDLVFIIKSIIMPLHAFMYPRHRWIILFANREDENKVEDVLSMKLQRSKKQPLFLGGRRENEA